ncbi:ATP-dependent zinc protease family protein [Luteimonas suaedae]|uniref:ATP-dependent zinc protease family protein n=1 Tax=Luteimonas suaedae TaxID=2605430 RepID=UPI001659EE87|nr:RimK/LysX family protein [Luteimonas suaedae]
MTAWIAACLLAVAAPAWPAEQRSKSEKARVQDIFGWVEWVEIGQRLIRLKAKLDTGATTSSLTADDIEIFRRSGKRHVRFTILDEGRDIEETIEARLVRHVRIRKHDGTTQRRPVVRLGMCLGDIYREHEFTLVDRSSFVYPVLVGRNYMRGHVLVDSGETFTRRPSCKQRSSSISPGMDRATALRLAAE